MSSDGEKNKGEDKAEDKEKAEKEEIEKKKGRGEKKGRATSCTYTISSFQRLSLVNLGAEICARKSGGGAAELSSLGMVEGRKAKTAEHLKG